MNEILISGPDGNRLFCHIEGDEAAPPVLFSHSLGATHAIWEEQAQRLKASHRVIRHDSRGHGRSDTPDGDYSAEKLGRDALAVLDGLGIAKASFVGLSMGGIAGMWLAIHAPERVDRLVIANSAAFIPVKDVWDVLAAEARRQGLSAIGERTILGWLSEASRAAMPDRARALVATMQAMDVEGYARSLPVLRDVDLRADLARIMAPTLVIAGGDDTPSGQAAAAAIAEGIAGSRLESVPGAAHLSPAERPEAVGELLARHLAGGREEAGQ